MAMEDIVSLFFSLGNVFVVEEWVLRFGLASTCGWKASK